jgi:hypothetical protein
MSVPDRSGDTSRQPELSFPVHRGVFVPDKVHSSNSGLGMHWSASEKIAEVMTSHAEANRTSLGSGSHVIHHGLAPISSVETDFNRLYDKGVLSPSNLNENREQEVPLKRGAPVLVTGRTKGTLRNGVWKTRKRNYKTPREMKA